MEEPIQYIQFLLCLFLFNWNSFASASGNELDDINDKAEFKIEGKVYFSSKDKEWTMNTKVLVDGGNYLGFVKSDGSFVVNGIPSGSYVVEVANPDAFFETVRIEITSKGKMRARRINLLQPTHVKTVTYPLEFRERGKINYFHKREQWRLTDFLFNPMVLTMIVPLLLIMVLPKLMNAADVDTQKVVQERYSKEDNYHVTNKFVTSYSPAHGSELLRLSQKPHKSSTSAAFSGGQLEDNSRFVFKLKQQSLPVKDSHGQTELQGVLPTNSRMQTSAHTSKKEITFDNSWKKIGNDEKVNDISCPEKHKYVKVVNESPSCSEHVAVNQLDFHGNENTIITSPPKLSPSHKHRTGESPVSSSTAHTDLYLESSCRKDDTLSNEGDVSNKSDSNFNKNLNTSDEIPCTKGTDIKLVQSVVPLTENGSHASTSKQEEPSFLVNQSKDNETTFNMTDSDGTRTDNSITLTEESLLNFSLSDENMLLEVKTPSANASSLEMSSVQKGNGKCCTLVTAPHSEPNEQLHINKSNNESTLTLSVTLVSSLMNTESPTQTIPKQS